MSIQLSDTVRTQFAVSEALDALPTANCYAGTTLLGTATVVSLGGTLDYQASYTLPSSGITAGTPIRFAINGAVSAVSIPTLHRVVGVINNLVPTAAEISADVSDQISQDFVAGDYFWPNVLTGIGLECRYGIENGTGVPLKDNGITAAKIAAGALDNKGNWNIGKTGYALTSGERTSIASSVWASTTRVLTAFGFTVATDGPSRSASQANVSALATTAQLTAAQSSIEAACGTADVSTLLTTSTFNSSLPTNFSDLDVEVTTGKVTTANPAAGSGSSHTASDVAALILETPANKLATDASGRVTTENTPDLSAITAELAKMPRAPVPIAAGAFVMTITNGQDAEVTYSEPV